MIRQRQWAHLRCVIAAYVNACLAAQGTDRHEDEEPDYEAERHRAKTEQQLNAYLTRLEQQDR